MTERPLQDRLMIRAPVLARLGAAAGTRLAPGSGLRKRLIGWGFANAFAAVNRSDVEAVLVGYEPDAEVWTSGMEATGLRDCYRGHDGIREMFAELDAVFSEWGWTVHDLVDRGDRFAARIDFVTRGRSSGVETTVNDAGSAYRLSKRGLVARQDFFMESDGWRQAQDVLAP